MMGLHTISLATKAVPLLAFFPFKLPHDAISGQASLPLEKVRHPGIGLLPVVKSRKFASVFMSISVPPLC